jgi:hypothetical protein
VGKTGRVYAQKTLLAVGQAKGKIERLIPLVSFIRARIGLFRTIPSYPEPLLFINPKQNTPQP